MGDYGKLLLLLIAIGVILLAVSGKGFAVFQVLRGGVSLAPPSQEVPQPNPQNLDPGSGNGVPATI